MLAEMRDDFNKRFDELASKLDDRATKGMFMALQSDLGAAIRRIEALEDAADAQAARSQGVSAVLGWLARFGGWLIATAIGVAWLWLSVTHG